MRERAIEVSVVGEALFEALVGEETIFEESRCVPSGR
jgi:hypothetical protein